MTDLHLTVCVLGIALCCVAIGRSLERPYPPGHAIFSLCMFATLLVLGILIGGRP